MLEYICGVYSYSNGPGIVARLNVISGLTVALNLFPAKDMMGCKVVGLHLVQKTEDRYVDVNQ